MGEVTDCDFGEDPCPYCKKMIKKSVQFKGDGVSYVRLEKAE